jgi:hypothetical protein
MLINLWRLLTKMCCIRCAVSDVINLLDAFLRVRLKIPRHFENDFQVDCVSNVMAHAQKPDFVFRRNGRVCLNRQGRQFSRLLAGQLCTSACNVCIARASLCSAVTWRLLVTHSVLLFPLHFFSRASPCAITFQLDSKKAKRPNCSGDKHAPERQVLLLPFPPEGQKDTRHYYWTSWPLKVNL